MSSRCTTFWKDYAVSSLRPGGRVPEPKDRLRRSQYRDAPRGIGAVGGADRFGGQRNLLPLAFYTILHCAGSVRHSTLCCRLGTVYDELRVPCSYS